MKPPEKNPIYFADKSALPDHIEEEIMRVASKIGNAMIPVSNETDPGVFLAAMDIFHFWFLHTRLFKGNTEMLSKYKDEFLDMVSDDLEARLAGIAMLEGGFFDY